MGNFVSHYRGQLIVTGDKIHHAGVHRHLAAGKTPGIDLAVVLDHPPLPVKVLGKGGMPLLGGGHQSLHDAVHLLMFRRGDREHILGFQRVLPRDFPQPNILREWKKVELGSAGPGDGGAGHEAEKKEVDSHGIRENIGPGGGDSRGLECST